MEMLPHIDRHCLVWMLSGSSSTPVVAMMINAQRHIAPLNHHARFPALAPEVVSRVAGVVARVFVVPFGAVRLVTSTS